MDSAPLVSKFEADHVVTYGAVSKHFCAGMNEHLFTVKSAVEERFDQPRYCNQRFAMILNLSAALRGHEIYHTECRCWPFQRRPSEHQIQVNAIYEYLEEKKALLLADSELLNLAVRIMNVIRPSKLTTLSDHTLKDFAIFVEALPNPLSTQGWKRVVDGKHSNYIKLTFLFHALFLYRNHQHNPSLNEMILRNLKTLKKAEALHEQGREEIIESSSLMIAATDALSSEIRFLTTNP